MFGGQTSQRPNVSPPLRSGGLIEAMLPALGILGNYISVISRLWSHCSMTASDIIAMPLRSLDPRSEGDWARTETTKATSSQPLAAGQARGSLILNPAVGSRQHARWGREFRRSSPEMAEDVA